VWEVQLVELKQPADDGSLEKLAEESDAIAIDAPLGWPIAFTNAIVGHRTHRAWPEVPDIKLRLRVTDRRLGTERIWPLSVSTDRIGIVAFRAARLMPMLGRGPSPARDGSDGIYEVYPAAALARWAQQSRRYKRRDPLHEAGRRAILEWLVVNFRLDLRGHEERIVASSDLLDAVICAVLAREAKLGRTDAIPSGDQDAAREEGWIHMPRVEVTKLSARPAFELFAQFVEDLVLPLQAAHPDYERLDGQPTGGNRTIVATFWHDGRQWKVHADTHVDRLLTAYEAMTLGTDPFVHQATPRGNSLDLRSNLKGAPPGPKHLYIYEMSGPNSPPSA
jgi:hypothetical protein